MFTVLMLVMIMILAEGECKQIVSYDQLWCCTKFTMVCVYVCVYVCMCVYVCVLGADGACVCVSTTCMYNFSFSSLTVIEGA